MKQQLPRLTLGVRLFLVNNLKLLFRYAVPSILLGNRLLRFNLLLQSDLRDVGILLFLWKVIG